MRLWLLNRYKVLPTEQRYKDLTDEQVEILFEYFLNFPDDELIKRRFVEGEIAKSKIPPREQFQKMGYSEDEIDGIIEELSQADL